MPNLTFFKIKQFSNRIPLIRYRGFTHHTCNRKFQRVLFRGSTAFCPIRYTLLIYSTYFERISGFCLQTFKQQFGFANGSIKHTIELYFIEISIFNFRPCGFQRISFGVFIRNLWLRSKQCSCRNAILISRSKGKTFHRQSSSSGRNVRSSQFHQQLRVLCYHLFGKITAWRRKLVQIRRLIVEIHILARLECFQRSNFSELNLVFTNIGYNLLRLFGDIDSEFSSLLLYQAFEITLCRMDCNL